MKEEQLEKGFVYESHNLMNGSILQVRSFGRKKDFPYYEELRYFLDDEELSGLIEFNDILKEKTN